MPIRPFRSMIWGEVCAPCDRDEQALNALATVGALLALADGRVEPETEPASRAGQLSA